MKTNVPNPFDIPDYHAFLYRMINDYEKVVQDYWSNGAEKDEEWRKIQQMREWLQDAERNAREAAGEGSE